MFGVPWRAVGLAVCVALLGLAYAWGRHDGRVYERAAADAARVVALDAARARERALVVQVERVAGDAMAREQKLAADLDDTGADLRRMQQALFGAAGDGASTPAAADADPARRGLGECAGRLVEMAGRADRYAAQLTGLQDYVGRVCRSP